MHVLGGGREIACYKPYTAEIDPQETIDETLHEIAVFQHRCVAARVRGPPVTLDAGAFPLKQSKSRVNSVCGGGFAM